MSDRNNGLINAIREWFPGHPHAFCYHHLKHNIEAKYPGSNNRETRDSVIKLFTSCAYTFSKKRFHKKLDELKKEGGDVIKSFLSGLPFENWANSYFPGERYGEMCSNIVESFNSMVLKERALPITQLVDGIRSRLMRLIGERSHESSKWSNVLCPRYEKLLSNHVKAGENWIVNRSNEDVYEVLSKFTCTVDLAARSCSCNNWKFTGFPCVHAVTVMKFIDVEPYQYVDYYFKADTFRECYSHSILPIVQNPDEMPDEDEVPLLLPPNTKNQPGRPRTKRFKSSGETGKIKCGRCGQLGGHNRRTCSERI